MIPKLRLAPIRPLAVIRAVSHSKTLRPSGRKRHRIGHLPPRPGISRLPVPGFAARDRTSPQETGGTGDGPTGPRPCGRDRLSRQVTHHRPRGRATFPGKRRTTGRVAEVAKRKSQTKTRPLPKGAWQRSHFRQGAWQRSQIRQNLVAEVANPSSRVAEVAIPYGFYLLRTCAATHARSRCRNRARRRQHVHGNQLRQRGHHAVTRKRNGGNPSAAPHVRVHWSRQRTKVRSFNPGVQR